MNQYFDQQAYDVRCEWGPEGIRRLAPISDVVIIVDVISFTTTVDVAVSRGAVVYPFQWKDERAAAFARQNGAVLAAGSRRDPHSLSLAPHSMLRVEPGTALVLPSPNGSALSLAVGGAAAFAGCLRNAAAVAAAAKAAAGAAAEAAAGAAAEAAAGAANGRISVIPAGERWEDGSLRPALEDLLGAGAILHALRGRLSPEAEAAVGAFLHLRDRLFEVLSACGSGKEAIDRGTPEDVALAAEYNASSCAPRLIDGAYRQG